MNSVWLTEVVRLFFLLIATIFLGFMLESWIAALVIAMTSYIFWVLVQLRSFERWIRLGTNAQSAPEFSGIWQLIVQHILRTQRKNKDHKKRLGLLARRFEATIAALPDATIVLNDQSEIEWSNQAALAIFGIDKKKDWGARFDNLVRNPEIVKLLDSKKIAEQTEIVSPIDHLKTLAVSCVQFGDKQRLISARDVSQRVAVQKLRKAFVANASHELRTPLTVVSGYLEILESEDSLSANLLKQVSNAKIQAYRMQKILDDMLVLSRLEAKENEEAPGEIFDMANMLRTMVDDFIKTRETHHFELVCAAGLKLKADETEIYSLCQNLISNAIKYSKEGSLIQICWYQSKSGEACFSVEDNGEGIAAEHLARLTERFYRVSVQRSRQVGGTGLGLSIVKHILEHHRGRLQVESELGKGSTFTAFFPGYRVIITEKKP